MICKNCEKELPEGSVLCCFCGEPVEQAEEETAVLASQETAEEGVCETEEAAEEASAAEEEAAEELSGEETAEELTDTEEVPAPKKKAKVWIIILAVIAGVALLAVLAGAILYGLGINPFADNDILVKENYSVEDAVARDNKDVVVATIGEETLTSGELQIYYWETVLNFINSNYYYLSIYGLDISEPLDEQTCLIADDQTWQQFFLEAALGTWQRYTTLQLMAKEAGYELEAEMQTFLDSLPTSMESSAINNGFDSVQAWLEDNCGPGVSEAGYLEYVTAYYEGTFYLTSRYDDLNPTDAEVEAYFAENEATFASSGVTKDSGKYYDVRHILIAIEGGTEDEEGNVTYTDEEWAACQAEAQKLLDEWQEGDGTEDGFGTYAMLYSADGGSSTNGGLYSGLTADTSFVQEFKDWYLDESRQPGDTGLVQSTYGYHIMYFSGSSDIWFETAAEQLMAERISAYIDEGMEKYPMSVNYKKIVLGDHAIV